MAHWAEVDENNLVLRVVVGNNDSDDEGYGWIVNTLGGRWIQTSFTGSRWKNYAGKGFTFDENRDAFIPPQPYASWVLDEATCQWVAPIDYPADGGQYVWDETYTDWVEVQDETP